MKKYKQYERILEASDFEYKTFLNYTRNKKYNNANFEEEWESEKNINFQYDEVDYSLNIKLKKQDDELIVCVVNDSEPSGRKIELDLSQYLRDSIEETWKNVLHYLTRTQIIKNPDFKILENDNRNYKRNIMEDEDEDEIDYDEDEMENEDEMEDEDEDERGDFEDEMEDRGGRYVDFEDEDEMEDRGGRYFDFEDEDEMEDHGGRYVDFEDEDERGDFEKCCDDEYDKPASPVVKRMALDQAKFICYVGKELEEYLNKDLPFPEWFQNKLSAFHENSKNIHSMMAGKYKD